MITDTLMMTDKMTRFSLFLVVLCSALGWQASFASTASTMITVGQTTVMPLTDIVAIGLPVLCFETVDGELPTCDYVSAPAGSMGATITNATKVPGRLVVYQRIDGLDSVMYDSGDYEKDISGMTIKLRGNTSAYDAKKPYKIKLQKKADLLMRGNEATFKDKEWLLLKDDYMTTIVGFKVNELVGMVWTPGHRHVNVVINGDYRGPYLLCESVKRNTDCRLDVDKSGFIFEFDPYWWNEDVYVSSGSSPSYNYTFKYPDPDDILPEQLDYMQTLVRNYEKSVKNGSYTSIIDVESFAKWCLVHDIAGTQDAGGANLYYSKYDTTDQTPIVMPVTWDFDMAERTNSAWSLSHTSHMTTLFNSSNRAFVREYVNAWVKIRSSLVSDVNTFIRGFGNSDEGSAFQASMDLHKLVYGNSVSVSGFVAWHAGWFISRQPWLDGAIMPMNPLGDVNVDSKVDVGDVTALIDLILTSATNYSWAADLNNDDMLDVSDVTTLIQMILDH